MSDDDRLIYETEPAPSAIRLTVTPATLRRAEALGFVPGGDDVLLWALQTAEGWRDAYKVGCSVATGLDNMLSKAQAERDAARRDLSRIVQLCRDAVDHLEVTAIQPYGALADRLRVEAGARPGGFICGVVVRERMRGNVITRILCPLPPGHDGEHAETLAGDGTDTDTDRSAT